MPVDLRAFVFLDSIQSQLAAHTAMRAHGYFPLAGQASLWIEIAPGISINTLTDVAVKRTAVVPGVQVVERAYGLLEVHHDDQAEVIEAGRQVLEHLGRSESDRYRPRVVSTQVISNVDAHQAVLVNRTRFGHLLIEGETLHILEVRPAAYAVLAANQAEKQTPVKLVDVRTFGAYGRLYLAGSDAVIQEAASVVLTTLEGVDGRIEAGDDDV
jgi:ethanolamine utilization microcompartment shell protein EutS